MIEIKIDGKQIKNTKCCYAPFDVDGSMKKGDHAYQLIMPKTDFRGKVEETYTSERPVLDKAVLDKEMFIGRYQRWPDFEEVMERSDLLKTLAVWYTPSKILEWILPKSENPQWCIVTMDNIETEKEVITIEGTARRQ